MSLINNEQVKLTATAVNNIAVAFIIGGFVTPALGLFQQTPLAAIADVPPWMFGVAWVLTGLILHLGARLSLHGLKP
jgi:hypothetical protein